MKLMKIAVATLLAANIGTTHAKAQTKRNITHIIVHCTATPRGRHVTVDDVDRWHRARGFDGIGYHYLVYLDGSVHIGRAEERVGAHCLGHNATSIGVCYVGGLTADMKPADTRTDAQRRSLQQLLAELKQRYKQAVIVSHSDYANKSCPCYDATSEYSAM